MVSYVANRPHKERHGGKIRQDMEEMLSFGRPCMETDVECHYASILSSRCGNSWPQAVLLVPLCGRCQEVAPLILCYTSRGLISILRYRHRRDNLFNFYIAPSSPASRANETGSSCRSSLMVPLTLSFAQNLPR